MLAESAEVKNRLKLIDSGSSVCLYCAPNFSSAVFHPEFGRTPLKQKTVSIRSPLSFRQKNRGACRTITASPVAELRREQRELCTVRTQMLDRPQGKHYSVFIPQGASSPWRGERFTL
jgi:hypothetical protein